ncbi:hypothetical protein GQ53DRAFT_159421 [Thozetella sp. PMI_491]|nr:hypothetical protein GQ53DRAFT_159421 [Thozetella sp. PMI_491]
MELNSDSIHDVIHPTAAFSQSPPYASPIDEGRPPPAWADSQLNPKNRIDSLDPPKDPLWRIDGSTGQGTQFYALPLFMAEIPPMRFDVFIPEEATKDPLLRELLDLNLAFHTKDTERVRRLAVSNLILRRLQLWSQSPGEGSPEGVAKAYESYPFGSRIIFENLDLDIRNIRITVARTHFVERQFVALSNLRQTLRFDEHFPLPPDVDITHISHVQQLHDSTCTVRFNDKGRTERPGLGLNTETLWIFKALTSDTKYLYSELRALLRMPVHLNVMAKPDYLVTKKSLFGSKVGVVGFMLALHSGGSLRDVVPLLRVNGRLTLNHQLQWALELTSAVQHIREEGHMFYPDFRLDNIVMSSTWEAVMVDFEQRGVWCEFGAPEVNALDYVKILAFDTTRNVDDATIPEEIRQRYVKILDKLLPDWQEVLESEEYGTLPHHYDAYNVPWLCLDETEQEACEVYMLGRVLWCLFEGQSIPHTSAVWQSYRFEPDLEWPKFRFTPAPLRDIIDRCTSGRRPPMTTQVVRRGSKLVLRSDAPNTQRDPAEVLKVAREWWTSEVQHAEEFLATREKMKAAGEWTGNYYNRPTVKQVMEVLRGFAQEVGWKRTPLGN